MGFLLTVTLILLSGAETLSAALFSTALTVLAVIAASIAIAAMLDGFSIVLSLEN
jgi:hypothetical protein